MKIRYRNLLITAKKYKVLREPMSQQTLEKIKRLREIQKRIEKLEKIVSEINDLLENL